MIKIFKLFSTKLTYCLSGALEQNGSFEQLERTKSEMNINMPKLFGSAKVTPCTFSLYNISIFGEAGFPRMRKFNILIFKYIHFINSRLLYIIYFF
jgi:hypothetical protein